MPARILVVDDIVANVRLLEAKLTREFYEVDIATSGAQALSQIARNPPDLVLLDILMPEMSGFEVCRIIKSDPDTCHIPVVMVTALSEAGDRQRALNLGADDFLTKPPHDLALMARVRSLTRLKQIADEWRSRHFTSVQLGMTPADSMPLLEDATGANVLLVEGSEVQREVLSTMLRSDRHTVDVAGLDDAFAAIREQSRDLVIVSMMPGDEQPLRLCSHIRATRELRHLPLMVIADDFDLEGAARALDLGVNDYLLRPVDRSELVARTRTQIRRHRYQERLRTTYQESLVLSVKDSLTGLFNRRYFDAHLREQMQRTRQARRPMGVIALDIDRFKPINDTHRQAVGDVVLREQAARMHQTLRSVDMVSRRGGEEFAVLLPETEGSVAMTIAERLRRSVADRPFVASDDLSVDVTISLGVTMLEPADTVESVLDRADMALYAAKKSGRNCVISDIREGHVQGATAYSNRRD